MKEKKQLLFVRSLALIQPVHCDPPPYHDKVSTTGRIRLINTFVQNGREHSEEMCKIQIVPMQLTDDYMALCEISQFLCLVKL